MSCGEAILVEAIESLPDGISIYDAHDRLILCNEVTRKRFPHLFEAFQNGAANLAEAQRYAIQKARPDASEAEVDAIASYFAECVSTGTPYEVTSPDGRIIRVTFRPMSDGRRVGISFDVTGSRIREKELEAAKKAAETANESKSSFLANMSHEIRTPLNGIMGMAQVLESTALDRQQKEFVATILDSSKTLMALLNDVLDLSKIEAGKFDIVPTDASIHHMLRRQLKLWQPRAEEKGLELALAFDADLPAYASFDTVRVQQCVANLVSNAIKFTATGSIQIFAIAKNQPDGAHLIEIRVTDTGAGMDEVTMARLFRPFTQADETIQRAHGGTGLGLSITRRLAEMMGGSATATSEVGRGSTFRISFRAEAATSQPEAGISGRASLSGDIREQLRQSNLRVLLVDDHPVNRQVAALFLRPFNMRIVEAVNGAEALEALKRETFDLVLLDMHMPVMDGPTTIAAIRSRQDVWADIPVIALTADAMSGDRERYLAMGVNGYLSKPLAERDLLSEIARVRSGGVRAKAA